MHAKSCSENLVCIKRKESRKIPDSRTKGARASSGIRCPSPPKIMLEGGRRRGFEKSGCIFWIGKEYEEKDSA